MAPSKPGKLQTRSAFEFGMHGNEEQSEGKKMEVDSIVAPELRPIESKVVFGTRVFSSATNGSCKTKDITLYYIMIIIMMILE
jgi:hypothetical protein